jgi:YggT family protein
VNPNPFLNAFVFLIDALLGIYILFLMLRFILQWVHTSFRDPIFQIFLQITNPVLRPLYRFIPSWRNVDVAIIVLMLALEMIKVKLAILFTLIKVSFIAWMLVSLIELIVLFLYIFLFAIIIRVILSWVAPYSNSPLNSILNQLTDSIMFNTRRLISPIIPTIQGIDFSPFFATLFLLFLIKLVEPLQPILLRF